MKYNQLRELVSVLLFSVSLAIYFTVTSGRRTIDERLIASISMRSSSIPVSSESRANRERREANNKQKSSLKLTDNQYQIAIGSMLGDASLQTQSGGKTWRLKYQMSTKNSDYSQYIRKEFGKLWIPSEAHDVDRPNSSMMGFQTISSPTLQCIATLFIDPVLPMQKTER